MSVVRVSVLKQPSRHSYKIFFNSSQVKQGSEHSQRFHLNSSEIKENNERISGISF